MGYSCHNSMHSWQKYEFKIIYMKGILRVWSKVNCQNL
jgi:hypothetical protein